jgi:bifunctional non-homologous end joining protein LigD
MQSSSRQDKKDIPVFYYIFDILYMDGYDLTALELAGRKAVLQKALDFADPLRYLGHQSKEGERYFDYACRQGWEGVIAKDYHGAYETGKRSSKWLKFKCVKNQEFVIGGYTDPRGSRIGFGALLVGYHKDGKLKYAGKVGTGYDDETLKNLGQKLENMEQEKSPFDDTVKVKDAHWIKPELVAEIGFEEWTDYGKLRQPRYEGLRRDKEASEVVREDN